MANIAKPTYGLSGWNASTDALFDAVNAIGGDATAATLATKLPLAGGTLTGALTLNADPSSALGAATKQYVDAGYTRVFNVKAYGAVGDGSTNDTSAISSAITALTTAAGGILYFPPGTYQTDGGHSVTVPCTLRGAGYGTTATGTNGVSVLRLRNSANATLLTIAAKAVTVEDLGFAGNKTNQSSTSHGIATDASTSANYFRLNRVWIDNFRDSGLFLTGPGASLEGMATHLEVRNCGAYGIDVSSGAAADCQFTDCILAQNTTAGVQVNAGNSVFTACHFWGNTGPGVFMPSGAAGTLRMSSCYVETNGSYGVQSRGNGNIITGCYIWKNTGRGIYAFSNIGLVVQGCVITANNVANASGATGAGINLDTCTACTVTGNYLATGTGGNQKYGYAETGNTCNACLFSGNVSRATDHGTGNWLIGTGNPTATIPATPASYNVG